MHSFIFRVLLTLLVLFVPPSVMEVLHCSLAGLAWLISIALFFGLLFGFLVGMRFPFGSKIPTEDFDSDDYGKARLAEVLRLKLFKARTRHLEVDEGVLSVQMAGLNAQLEAVPFDDWEQDQDEFLVARMVVDPRGMLGVKVRVEETPIEGKEHGKEIRIYYPKKWTGIPD